MLLDNSKDFELLLESVQALDVNEHEVLLILVAENNAPEISKLQDVLKYINCVWYGAYFPALIYGDQRCEEGIILKKYHSFQKPMIIKGMGHRNFRIPDLNLPLEEMKDKTALIWVDGLSSNISNLLSQLYNKLGGSINYLGGGCGSLSLQAQPCLFDSEGIYQDAAILHILDIASYVHFRHGWKSIAGPYVATQSYNTTLIELNWCNAFEVYKDTVEQDLGAPLEPDNFFSISKGYPFGIFKKAYEKIVRDPISVNDKGEIQCVGEIPENAALMILKGDDDNLIEAARRTAEYVSQQLKEEQKVEDFLIIDCISRVLYLEDKFYDELKKVKDEISLTSQVVPIGVLSLGEIACAQDGYPEFLNKTFACGLFYK